MTLAIYIHWPFCVSKCPYCDFNSHVGETHPQDVWRHAYERELVSYAQVLRDRTVTSIFFGGGTPSLMEAKTVEHVVQTIARLFRLADDIEITLEANPSSVEAAKFAAFRASGVNRLSLGVQSLDDASLAFLGRAHDVNEAKRAITVAGNIFKRFSFDLIYARQGQTADAWERELRAALTLAGDHLSLYQLTIEPHTPFHTRTRRGETLVAQDDHSVAMFELTQEMMTNASMPAYEISNHARAGQASRHNLTYWRYDDYLGIGPGAHGRYRHDGMRLASENHRAPETWLLTTNEAGKGIKHCEAITDDVAMREAVMMGLRLSEGIHLARWRQKFPLPLTSFLSRTSLEKLKGEGYLVEDTNFLRATPAGLQRLNSVLSYLEDASQAS